MKIFDHKRKKSYIYFCCWWWWREGWWWERPDCYILKSDKLISFKIWLVQQAMYLFWDIDHFGSPTLIGLKRKSGVKGLLLECDHCVESVCIRSYSGPYFLTFGLNTERYFVFCCIQSKCRKIQTRITPNTETFYAADDIVLLNVWIKWEVIAKVKLYTVISSYVICKIKMGSSLAKISIKDIILNHQISWKNKKVQRLYQHVFDEVSLFRNEIKRIEMWYKELCWTKVIKYKSSRQVHFFFLKSWRFALTKRHHQK